MKKILFVIILNLFFGCVCGSYKDANKNTIKRTELNQNQPSLKLFDFDIVEFNIIGDTLKIVSTSDFLYYPFGVFKNEKEFSNQYLFMSEAVDCIGLYRLFRFSYKESSAKFWFNEETGRLELVSAKVIDNSVVLNNEVKIGISKSDFIELFTKEIKYEQIKEVKVIELISGVLGCWHYYNFENEVLTSFYFNTDYQFDKN